MTEITGQMTISSVELKDCQKSISHLQSFANTINKNLGQDTSQLIKTIMAGAVILDCSDIHLEPEEKKVKLRVRIDGVLHDVLLFDPTVYNTLLSRIKLVSGVKLNITNRSQDGRFTFLQEQEKIEIRTSVLPAEYGESVVMRVLNPKTLLRADELGIREDLIAIFKKEIAKPNGMIIITGPTGSGKTTTLYAILKEIQNPEIKIITIEDPIEYHLEGISQTQVNPEKGYDFANGLEAIVRQDPDVILVGEIRDFETAQIALQASLTGHLVLATLHTNDAAGTVARLQALGEKSTNIAPAINLIIGQRLVRKICSYCRQLISPTTADLTKIERALKSLPEHLKQLVGPKLSGKSLKIAKAKGCLKCNHSGFRGRTGLFEFLVADDEIKNLVFQSPSVLALQKKAKEKGMATMKEDGFIKVLNGVTTIEEVERVTGE